LTIPVNEPVLTRNWHPAVVLLAARLTIAIGARQNMGCTCTHDDRPGMSRQTFPYAIAIQNLFYGFAQPFSGMIADRFGAARVM
jgi:MFS family permease